MTDVKDSALTTVTPIITDKVRGLDDPGGTPDSVTFLLSAMQNLFLSSVPRVRAYNNADITIADSTLTVIALPNERFDSDTMHDNTTNNSRLTCKTAGLYKIEGTVLFKPNATGRRFAVVRLNGSSYIGQDETCADVSNYPALNVSSVYELAVNDYVELLAFQSSGGNLDTHGAAGIGVEFMMWRVG